MKETFTPEPILNPNPMVRPIETKKSFQSLPVVLTIVVFLLAVGTGYVMAKKGSSTSTSSDKGVTTSNSVNSDTEAGINDTTAFPDTAEGTLVEGGIGGEGTHHLDRGMGESKNVYISSTVINLQNFVGKKVKVWGQTISGKKAGWLMDVGKIQVTQ